MTSACATGCTRRTPTTGSTPWPRSAGWSSVPPGARARPAWPWARSSPPRWWPSIGVGAALQQGRPDRPDVVATQPSEQALIGTYVVDVPDSPAARREGLVGRWVISLEADGALELRPPPSYTGATTGAAWRVEDELLRTDALVEPGCQADNGYVGTYRWSLTDDLLVFSLVDDACAVRRALFTGSDWERVP